MPSDLSNVPVEARPILAVSENERMASEAARDAYLPA